MCRSGLGQWHGISSACCKPGLCAPRERPVLQHNDQRTSRKRKLSGPRRRPPTVSSHWLMVGPHSISLTLPNSRKRATYQKGKREEKLMRQNLDGARNEGKIRKRNPQVKQRQSLPTSYQHTQAQPGSEEWLVLKRATLIFLLSVLVYGKEWLAGLLL